MARQAKTEPKEPKTADIKAFRVTARQREAVERYAASWGLNLTEAIRRMITVAAKVEHVWPEAHADRSME